ncbi:DegT/DnrJ/EryC1/StrS family aminotransferase [bacterium]|nr:DegT/DnrJ/EryC1/StrS family aminotransferase [bacterium]
MSVPFNDLNAQYVGLKTEIDAAMSGVIESSSFVRGSYVERFELEFSEAIGAKYCVSCANGTDALFIAMKALGLKSGDQVIAPAHSWISTTSSITQAGGEVVFCDTDKENFTLNPELLESLLTKNTVGIIPVHLYGQPADMAPIMSFAKEHNLWVIEDCAQAHLAEYNGKTVGTIGDVGTFSFYPGKNLGAMGDAGAVVTADNQLAKKMAMIARHGGLSKGDHQIEGINSRLDGIQAAILSVKLPRLLEWTQSRRTIAARYTKGLMCLDEVQVPQVASYSFHAWHLFVIKIKERDKLAVYLKEKGIQTVINYPVALPFLPAYAKKNHLPEDFPCAFDNQSQVLSLPIYPDMSNAQVDYVIAAIKNFYS